MNGSIVVIRRLHRRQRELADPSEPETCGVIDARLGFADRAMPISFQEILDAFEFVSMSGPLGEHQAFLCKQTGKTYWRIQSSDLDELDELPEDVENHERYVAIPDKRELGLGKPLVLDFTREFLPKDFNEVRYIFSKRGAYQKFRALLAQRGAVDRWREFESKATERALREWCELNSIAVAD